MPRTATLDRAGPENAFFPVDTHQVSMLGGNLPIEGYKAVYRSDTGRPLAVVGSRYTLVPHREVFDAVRPHVLATGKDFQPSSWWGSSGPDGTMYLSHGGARWYCGWVFAGPQAEEFGRHDVTGDPLDMGIRLRNSYDGSMAVELDALTVRRLCQNVAAVPSGTYSLALAHFVHRGEKGLIVDKLDSLMGELVAKHRASVERLNASRELVLERSTVTQIVSAWDAPAKVQKAILGIINGVRPMGAEVLKPSAPLTAFDAFNAATWVFTHEVPELARVDRRYDRLPWDLVPA